MNADKFCRPLRIPGLLGTVIVTSLVLPFSGTQAAPPASEPPWQPLPLIKDGNVDAAWVHTGWGKFVVDEGALRTESDPKGLGLLVFKKERFGNCQLRIVFKTKDERSNSGLYVRIADGILDQAGKTGAAFERDGAGKIPPESMERMKKSAEREEGPWFAVHRGYEVQIVGPGGSPNGTGSIYSLAPAKNVPKKASGEWRTMVITLAGPRIHVDLDGQRITNFDAGSPDLPPRKQWHEPKREPKRPEIGYLGLQTHDPGDVVWFKEISVRPLVEAK